MRDLPVHLGLYALQFTFFLPERFRPFDLPLIIRPGETGEFFLLGDERFDVTFQLGQPGLGGFRPGMG